MDEAFIGSIILFAGNFAPQGWLLCQGQTLPVSQYTALYSVIGNTYGGTPGQTFALPNLCGRVPVHPGAGVGTVNLALGQTTGSAITTIPGAQVNTSGTFSLNQAQIPAHNHPATATVTVATATSAGDDTAAGNILAGGTSIFAAPTAKSGALGGVSATVTVGNNTGTGAPVTVTSTGLSQPRQVSTQSPALALNYIICNIGIYPVHP